MKHKGAGDRGDARCSVLLRSTPGAARRTRRNDYPDAMVVVPPVGMGGSTQLDEWAEKNNVELRRYTDGVDLANAEKWVAELYTATEGTRPSAAVRLDGKIVVVPVNDELLQSLDNLR